MSCILACTNMWAVGMLNMAKLAPNGPHLYLCEFQNFSAKIIYPHQFMFNLTTEIMTNFEDENLTQPPQKIGVNRGWSQWNTPASGLWTMSGNSALRWVPEILRARFPGEKIGKYALKPT